MSDCPSRSPEHGVACEKPEGHRPAFHEGPHPNGIEGHKVLWHGTSKVQAVPVVPLEANDGGP